MLGIAAVASLTLPFALGVLRVRTLPPAPTYTYAVAPVKSSASAQENLRIMPGPQGGMRAENVTVTKPEWVRSAHFDLSFTPDRAETPPGPNVERGQMEGFIDRQRP
jgi:hypothetical protein